MPLSPLPPTDTRPLFRPVSSALVTLLRGLTPADFERPTIAGRWVVRDVQRGTALIEGRMGVIEVDQGDFVPGLGRVDAIRKQDGRWVVVTSKGIIMPAR